MQETQQAWVRSLGQEDVLEERTWQPIPVLLPGESYEQKNLADYSPWGHRELDMTERLTFSLQWAPQPFMR